jgi:hypothetical protein
VTDLTGDAIFFWTYFTWDAARGLPSKARGVRFGRPPKRTTPSAAPHLPVRSPCDLRSLKALRRSTAAACRHRRMPDRGATHENPGNTIFATLLQFAPEYETESAGLSCSRGPSLARNPADNDEALGGFSS